MFLGSSQHRLDEKGRVVLPPKFREVLREKLDETLVITAFDLCLIALPLDMMQRLATRLLPFPFFRQGDREFMRVLLKGAQTCQPDRQGRILLPPKLRDPVGIGQEVAFIGLFEYFEIWNPEALERQVAEGHANFNQLAEDFSRHLADSAPESAARAAGPPFSGPSSGDPHLP